VLFIQRKFNSLKSSANNFPKISADMLLHWKKALYYNGLITSYSIKNCTFDELKEDVRKKSFSKSLYLKTLLQICIYLCFICIICILPRRKRAEINVSLVYSLADTQIYRNGSTNDLLSFFRSSQLGIPDNYVIYVERKSLVPYKYINGQIRVVNNISLFLCLDFLGIREKLMILMLVFKRLFICLRALAFVKSFHLIAISFIFEETIWFQLSKSNRINVNNLITTQSTSINLDYAFQINAHLGRRIMIWYSANSIPIKYRDNTLPRFKIDETLYQLMSIDKHLVWTKDHKNYLSNLVVPSVEILVCGSMMFYYPKEGLKPIKAHDILIFDVTPYIDTKSSFFSIYPDALNSIYNSAHTIRFIQDIVWVKEQILLNEGILLNLALKSKRKISSNHDKTYIDFLKTLSKNGVIQQIHPEMDIFQAIKQSRLCISYPFTSTSVIANELNIPTVYYLQSDIMTSYTEVNGVRYIGDKKLLLKFVSKMILKDIE
jgi:polysaccharide biosynthesis PFTS motif protein